MEVKYRVYYSLSSEGPWTLANETLIDNTSGGNSYEITGLQDNTLYYFRVVGGTLDEDNVFVPLVGQDIGPLSDPALGLDSLKGIVSAMTFTPKANSDDILGLGFTVI